MNTPQSTSGDDSDIENKPEEDEYTFKTNVSAGCPSFST